MSGTVDTSVSGGLAWGASLNQNFVSANQTSSVAWSLIWSTLDGLEYANRGMMGAYEPWSGHFDVRIFTQAIGRCLYGSVSTDCL